MSLCLNSNNDALAGICRLNAHYCTGCVESAKKVADGMIQRRDEKLSLLEADLHARLSMTVARLGGTVEGRPTEKHNYLQRIDELREKELQIGKVRDLYEWAKGHWDHDAKLLVTLRTILREPEKRECLHAGFRRREKCGACGEEVQ